MTNHDRLISYVVSDAREIGLSTKLELIMLGLSNTDKKFHLSTETIGFSIQWNTPKYFFEYRGKKTFYISCTRKDRKKRRNNWND